VKCAQALVKELLMFGIGFLLEFVTVDIALLYTKNGHFTSICENVWRSY